MGYNDYGLNFSAGNDAKHDWGIAEEKPFLEKVALNDSIQNYQKTASNKLRVAWNRYKGALTWVWGEANEMQKSIQRKFWSLGAEEYLRKGYGYETSAWMLEHSLQDNPSDIWRGNDSRIAYLINNDSAYLQELDIAIKNAKDGWIDNKPIGVEFETGDLYYSIHKSTIYLNGYKREDGKWIINARMSDTYDFTEITSFMSNDNGWSWNVGKGTIANDVAVVSQKTGAIQPYRVTVDFWTVR